VVRLSWVATPECLPDGRRQAGDRHLNFHKGRDNLLIVETLIMHYYTSGST